MPGHNLIIEGIWDDDALSSTTYDLDVEDGTGSGDNILAGTWMLIEAGPPPTPTKEFDHWEITIPAAFGSYQGAFIDVNNSNTQFIMGEGDITLTAVYREIKYPLTVKNGTGGGSYEAGEAAIIEAGPPPAHSEFAGWTTSSGGTFGDSASMQTTYTVPAGGATVTANYRVVEFELTVENGSGSGIYSSGDRIPITAVPPPGEVFDRWVITGGGGTLGSQYNADTTFVMPGVTTTVTAIFRPIEAPLSPGQTGGGADAAGPGTGDDSNMPVWWLLLASSALGILCILLLRKRRQLQG